MTQSESIFKMQISPIRQAISVILATLFVMLVLKALLLLGWIEQDLSVYWEAALTMLMIYMIFTAIWSLSHDKKTPYLMYSIAGYVVVAIVSSVLAHLFSGLTMDEAGSFRWLYLLFTVCYLILMGIVNAMRTIIELVKKQDAKLRGEDN